MSTTLKFEYYEILVPKSLKDKAYASVVAALKGALQTPYYVDNAPLRVETLSVTEEYVFGTATKTALTDLPYRVKVKLKGEKAKPLNLDEDEGLGKPTAFLVTQLANRMALVIHRNWAGLRVGGFLDLLEAVTNKPGEFDAIPVIEEGKLLEVMAWGEYRKLEARISNPASPDLYESEAARDVAEMSKQFQARSVSFVLSSGRGKKWSLAVDQVREAITDFLRVSKEGRGNSKNPAGKVKSLVITGRNMDRELGEEIDLLKNRLVRKIDVPGDPKTIEMGVLERAVQQAYQLASRDLEKHFGV